MRIPNYPFLPADAKTTVYLSDIRAQIAVIRSALDALDEVVAWMPLPEPPKEET